MNYSSKVSTTVAPEVLTAIARMAVLNVPGVIRLAEVPGGVNRVFRRGAEDGVQIRVEDQQVEVNLYLILDGNVNLREVSRNVQQQVARAIQEMVGMDVIAVHVHIENVEYPSE